MSTAEGSKEYVTEFLDGPLQGTTQHRLYIDGDYEKVITAYVAVEGLPSELRYVASASKQVGDTLFVSYKWDASGSDSIEVDEQDSNV
ncbi:MAG: hypothetical protein FWD85_08105 [Microbacteriaceae bacterium]|nr:hypothetical protein [Microbacteriaceae bacterium]MCL2795253.1 hypothetical protein [Microbacteriaceae bacterium]